MLPRPPDDIRTVKKLFGGGEVEFYSDSCRSRSCKFLQKLSCKYLLIIFTFFYCKIWIFNDCIGRIYKDLVRERSKHKFFTSTDLQKFD